MKKGLFVTYLFSPDAAVGAVRPEKCSKYLPGFGWEPAILIVKDTYYDALDQEFAWRILELARDEGRRQDMGERAALRARSCFSASRMGKRYRVLHRQCLGQAASALSMAREEGRLGCG